jgi:starch synthase
LTRVLFLAQSVVVRDGDVPPHGAGAHVAATLNGLRRHFEVLVVSADDEAAPSRPLPSLRRRVPSWLRGLRHDLRVLGQDRRFAARALEVARAFRPDVVYARSEYLCLDGVRVARELAVPLVLEVNGLLVNDVRTMYRSPLEALGTGRERRKLRYADAIVTVSPGLARLLEGAGADPRKVTVVPNSVAPERVRAPRSTREAPVVVGWIGHVMRWHLEALELLVDVAPEVVRVAPEVEFLIIGGGPGTGELAERASSGELAGRFRFAGPVPYAEVPARLAEIDLGVIPAVFSYAFPVKLVEFGAAGIPVVAPQSASLDEQLVPGEEYEPFRAGDREALAAALGSLANDPERRRRLGGALQRAVSRRFTWTATGETLREVVGRVLPNDAAAGN